MIYSNNRIAKRIAKLAKGDDITWNIKDGKIYLHFKIILSDVISDYIVMAAFTYKKLARQGNNSEYILEFECDDEKNLEKVIANAKDICGKIIEDARDMSQSENNLDLKDYPRLRI